MAAEITTRTPSEIRQALLEALEASREDQRRFTRATWLLTPVLLAALLAALAFLAGMIALRAGLQKDFSSAFRWVTDLLFAMLYAAFLLHKHGLRKLRGPAALWLLGATAALALLLLLSLMSPLRHGVPWLFWGLLYGLGLAMVVMLGATYEPADLSGLAEAAGPARDADSRNAVGSAAGGEVVLGCLAAGPLLLFGSWADILRMRWLDRRFSTAELETATHLLLALGRLDHEAADRIRKRCSLSSADRVIKGLEYIGWLETGETLFKLTPEGKAAVGAVWKKNEQG